MCRYWALGLIGALLAACSTAYKEEGFGGGYSDIPLAQNVVQVSARGNGYTSEEKVRKIALVRAADITIQSGFSTVVILGVNERSSSSVGGYVPGTNQSTTTGQATVYGNNAFGSASTSGYFTPASPIIVTKHKASFTIRMFRPGEPGAEQGLNAKGISRMVAQSAGIVN